MKAKPCRWYRRGAARGPLSCSESFLQPKGFVQHGPILRAALGTGPAARRSLHQLRLAAAWVAASVMHRIPLLCQAGSLRTFYPPSLERSLETDSGSVGIASEVPNVKHRL